MQHQRIAQFREDGCILGPKGFVTASSQSVSNKTSLLQPVGTQGRLIDAAVIAEHHGRPINRLLTIRTMALENMDAQNRFNRRTLAEDVQDYCELLRKWLIAHEGGCAFIWAREWGAKHGEHLHIGFHLEEGQNTPFADQCERWFGEPAKSKAPAKAVIAESIGGIWNLKHCLRDGKSGAAIAAYLGKDEPEFRVSAWGNRKPNTEKRDCRHSEKAGLITGLPRHTYRHGVSKNISPSSAAGQAILARATNEERLIGVFDRLPY